MKLCTDVQYFVARGFKESTSIDNTKAVSKLDRQQLLNPVLSSAETCKRILFVLTWRHKFHRIGKILHQTYFQIIKDHLRLKSTFPEPPLLSFRPNKNLKDILVHPGLQSFTHYNKTVPCNHQSCLLCQSMSNADTVKSPNSGLSWSLLQSVPTITSYALDFQHVSFTYILITTDVKTFREISLVNLSSISTTMVATLAKTCVFTIWKIIYHFQRTPVSFARTTGF